MTLVPALFGGGNLIFLNALATHWSTLGFLELASTSTEFTAPPGPSVALTLTVAVYDLFLPPAPRV